MYLMNRSLNLFLSNIFRNKKYLFLVTLISFFISYFIEQYYILDKGWFFLLEITQ
jgi:hypothetical protein